MFTRAVESNSSRETTTPPSSATNTTQVSIEKAFGAKKSNSVKVTPSSFLRAPLPNDMSGSSSQKSSAGRRGGTGLPAGFKPGSSFWENHTRSESISNAPQQVVPPPKDSRITSQTPAPVPKPVDTFDDFFFPPQLQHPPEPTSGVLAPQHLRQPARKQPTAGPELAGRVEPARKKRCGERSKGGSHGEHGKAGKPKQRSPRESVRPVGFNKEAHHDSDTEPMGLAGFDDEVYYDSDIELDFDIPTGPYPDNAATVGQTPASVPKLGYRSEHHPDYFPRISGPPSRKPSPSLPKLGKVDKPNLFDMKPPRLSAIARQTPAQVSKPVDTSEYHSPYFKRRLSETPSPPPPEQGKVDKPNLFDKKPSRLSAIASRTPAQVSKPVDTSEYSPYFNRSSEPPSSTPTPRPPQQGKVANPKQFDMKPPRLSTTARLSMTARQTPEQDDMWGDEVDASEASLKPSETISFNGEQEGVINLAVEGSKNIFFTGAAGTGKSFVLRELIRKLKSAYPNQRDAVAVTASTGIAACNIGGVTLHSFSGIGLGAGEAPELADKVKKNRGARSRWLRTKVLIIDEISMIDGALFEKLETIARLLRVNARPFGGIQLIITGDFFQLPPIRERNAGPVKFAFESIAWGSCIEHTIELRQVFRQKDPELALMLNELRTGQPSPRTVKIFNGLSRPLSSGSIETTELFPTRHEVEMANNSRLRLLPGAARRFTSTDRFGPSVSKMSQKNILNGCMAPPLLELKVGSQVMLVKNINEHLVNGTLGRVTGFMDEKSFKLSNGESGKPKSKTPEDPKQEWPLVQFSLMDGSTQQLLCLPEEWVMELPDGEVQAARVQVPLILAWALSIHKAQGQTLDRVKVQLGRSFEGSQAYVALSRATSMEGLQVIGFNPTKIRAHEKVRNFYSSLQSPTEAAENAKHGQFNAKATAKQGQFIAKAFAKGV